MLPRYLEIPLVCFYWMCPIFQESTQQLEIFTTSCSEITPSQISKAPKFILSLVKVAYTLFNVSLCQSKVWFMKCYEGLRASVNRAVFGIAWSNIAVSLLNLVKFKLDLEIQSRSQKKDWLGVRNCSYTDWKHTEAEDLSNWHKDFQIHFKD